MNEHSCQRFGDIGISGGAVGPKSQILSSKALLPYLSGVISHTMEESSMKILEESHGGWRIEECSKMDLPSDLG